MTQHSGITKPALQPGDIAMLQAVLQGWCQEKSCVMASPRRSMWRENLSPGSSAAFETRVNSAV